MLRFVVALSFHVNWIGTGVNRGNTSCFGLLHIKNAGQISKKDEQRKTDVFFQVYAAMPPCGQKHSGELPALADSEGPTSWRNSLCRRDRKENRAAGWSTQLREFGLKQSVPFCILLYLR